MPRATQGTRRKWPRQQNCYGSRREFRPEVLQQERVRKMKSLSLFSLICAAALLAAGCAQSDSDSSAPVTEPTDVTTPGDPGASTITQPSDPGAGVGTTPSSDAAPSTSTGTETPAPGAGSDSSAAPPADAPASAPATDAPASAPAADAPASAPAADAPAPSDSSSEAPKS